VLHLLLVLLLDLVSNLDLELVQVKFWKSKY